MSLGAVCSIYRSDQRRHRRLRHWVGAACLAVFLGLVLPAVVQAQAHVLERMQRLPGARETILQFELDSPTQVAVSTLGQRVVVSFERTAPAEGLAQFTPGGDLISSQVNRAGTQTEVTVLLRRPPEDVETLTSEDEPVARVALRWPTEGRQLRPGITTDPGGQLSVVGDGTVAGQYLHSEYSGQWDRFFQSYSAPVKPWVEMRMTRLPVDVMVEGMQTENVDALALQAARDTNWEGSVSALTPLSSNATNPSQAALAARGLLALESSRAALGRVENAGYAEPFQTPLDVRMAYLRLSALADLGRIYVAWADYEGATLPEETSRAMRLYWQVLGAELALKAGQPRQALRELDEAPMAGEDAVRLVAARRLQTLYALERWEDAWRVGQETVLPLDFLRQVPAVLERYADLLYRREEFSEAMRHYNALADSLTQIEPKAMSLWRMGVSLRDNGRPGRAKRVMDLILEQWPETAAGYRARVVQNDISVLDNLGELTPSHVTAYEEVMDNAPQRAVREEAGFKRILVMRELGELPRAVAWLSDFLVAFGAGDLQNEAKVLMGELLPPVVRGYLEQGDYVRGLALVAEHREILVRTDMPHAFLERVGDTFEELGLNERAARVFLYMLARSGDPERRALLLPRVVRLWKQMDDPMRAAEYAEIYLQEFPEGTERAAVIGDTAESFLEAEEPERALDWLLPSQRPYSRRLDVLTARALYAVEQYERMGRYLERSTLPQEMLAPRTRYIWADSLYQQGAFAEALPLWRTLFEDEDFATRALYKGAECLTQLGRTEEAAKLYTRLAEETDNPVWQQMAEESRAMQELDEFLAEQ
ncbi:MAG: tetratricopeptide repeat protein [Thermodesulfobacteriota bacterium]